MPHGIEPGQLVSSKAGRDRGRYYLIYEIVSERLVRVVDGQVKRIEKPKAKNIKHLCFHPQVAEEIAVKLKRGERVTNAEIREALQRLVAPS
ncbi:KOW domain-containing RNA-binding protein [Desulfothermobacter acidiphilus]|uniref:KOW domain-containing RNA-binding protein n=1 Tax=Desulfothermobacter acidiphilus TaxID=1938353 RepID=UPI003F8BFEC1